MDSVAVPAAVTLRCLGGTAQLAESDVLASPVSGFS